MDSEHLPRRNGSADPLQRQWFGRFQIEPIGDECARAGGNDDAVARGGGLKPGREIRRLAEHGQFCRGADRDRFANDDRATGNADTTLQFDALDRVQRWHGGSNIERRADCAFGVILMRSWIAEIDQHAIAHEFRHEPLVACDAGGNVLLVGFDHTLQNLQVKCCGEVRGVDQVAEHHREVALFGGCPRSDGGKRRGGESIDRGTKLLAIAERQAEFAKIGIGQGRQYRGIDLLGTEHLDMFRQSDFAQPTRYVDVSLQTCRALSQHGLSARSCQMRLRGTRPA